MKKLIVLILFIGLFLTNNAKSEEVKSPWIKVVELAVLLNNSKDAYTAVKEVNSMSLIARLRKDYVEFQVINKREIEREKIGFGVRLDLEDEDEVKAWMILYLTERRFNKKISFDESELLAKEFLALWYQGQEIPDKLMIVPGIKY